MRNSTSGALKSASLRIRDSGKTAVARFEGDRRPIAAEALRGSLVEIDRSALPPLEEGEYYHVDLIGLPAFDQQGNAIGHCRRGRELRRRRPARDRARGRQAIADPVQARIADLEDGRIVLDPDFLA